MPIYSHKPAIQAFYESHGGHTQVDSWILFEDGAMLEHNGLSYGVMKEPPPDPHQCAKQIHRYWQIRAEQCEVAFLHFKAMCEGKGGGQWPSHIRDDDGKVAHLKLLHREAQKARARLRKARAAVDAAEPDWLAAIREERADEAKRRQQFVDRISEIQL